LDVDEAGLRLKLQLGFFWNDQLKIDLRIGREGGQVVGGGINVDAIANLLDVQAEFVGWLGCENGDFGVLWGLHFDAAISDVVDNDDRAAGNGIVLFDLPNRGARGNCAREQEDGSARNWKCASDHAETHVSLRSFRDRSSRTAIRLFADRRQPST